jgi:hypothetical protein
VALNLKSESREVQKSNPKSKSQFGPGPEVRKSNPKSESKVRKINLGRSSPPAIRTSVRSPNPESECVQTWLGKTLRTIIRAVSPPRSDGSRAAATAGEPPKLPLLHRCCCLTAMRLVTPTIHCHLQAVRENY